MPLEVVDARTEEGPSRVLRSRTLWEGPDFAKHVAAVRRVVEEVREEGDVALARYSKLVYGAPLTPDQIRVTVEERDAAAALIDPKVMTALEGAAERIRTYHDTQMPADWSMDREGAVVGQVFRAVRRVGLHAPAGGYPLPSSFLMTVIPARSAGVDEIAVCCPAGPDGDPAVMMAAAKVAGVEELYRIGGAHAIAALAIGTETVRACDKVCGPGRSVHSAREARGARDGRHRRVLRAVGSRGRRRRRRAPRLRSRRALEGGRARTGLRCDIDHDVGGVPG